MVIRNYCAHGEEGSKPVVIEPLEPFVDAIAEEDEPQFVIDAHREKRLAIWAPSDDPYVWSCIDLGDVLSWCAEHHPELLRAALRQP